MKKMIALLLAAMLLLSLAACASTADPAPAADAAPAETAETTSAAEEAPAAETDAEAPITLSYWLPCNDLEDGAAEQKGVIATARAFMEKYPNITLDLVPIGGNSDDYNAKFQMGASVKAPYRNAVTAIITGATDIDGAMQFVADWQASIG